MSILVIGASGYIGQAFIRELEIRQLDYETLSRSSVDYTQFGQLYSRLKNRRPSFVINTAGYAGRPNVDTCEIKRAETLKGNLVLPQTIANACAALNIPCGHVSSGCIYNNGTFSESDPPNFSFRNPPCSFYSGTKAMAEEVISEIGQCYVWRLRLPFDEHDGDRNYLSKLLRYEKVYDNTNSLSHRADFVKACLDTWKIRAPFGVYNMTNPGSVTARQVVDAIKNILKPDRGFEFWENDREFYKFAVAPRSNCVLDVSKLLATGVAMRPVMEAVEHSLRNWKPECVSQ